MNWLPLSLAAALTQAMQFAVVKGSGRHIAPLVFVFWNQVVGLAAWIGFFAVSGQTFRPSWRIWPAVVASAVLVIGMSGLLARASARGDISIVGPILALSPIFSVVPDALLTGALPSALGWVGLALTLVGTVTLSGGESGGRLRALFGRRDALDALGAAILLGVLASVDRWGALALGPSSYLLCSYAGATVASGIVVAISGRGTLTATPPARDALTLAAHALLGVAGTGLQTTALTMAPAAYVNATRRMSSVLAVVLGRALFGEPDLARRLVAAALACAGAACLVLAR